MSVDITTRSLLPVRRDKQTWTNVNVTGGGSISGTSGQPPAYVNIINGTPSAGQIAVFHDGSSIEGDARFAYNNSDGSLLVSAYDASEVPGSTIGTDGGNIVIKAGDSLDADSGSTNGNVILVPGNPNFYYGNSYIYFGNNAFTGDKILVQVAGTRTNIDLAFYSKNAGTLAFASGGAVRLTGSNIQILSDTIYIGVSGPILSPAQTNDANGIPVILHGGNVSALSTPGNNYNGGDISIYGGAGFGSGAGGSVYLGGTTNSVKIAKDGEMSFQGTATVWDDLRVSADQLTVGSGNIPALVDWTPSGSGATTKAREFAKDDLAYFKTQLPHGYKEGSDLHVHMHWTPRNYGSGQNGNTVGWKVLYSIANIDSTFGALQTADLSDACDGTNDKHQMTPSVTISGSYTISAMIIGTITRTDTGTDDTWSETISGRLPLLLELDFHYEIDTVGSKTNSGK